MPPGNAFTRRADLPGLGARCGSDSSSSLRSCGRPPTHALTLLPRCSDWTLRPPAPSASQLGEQGTGTECTPKCVHLPAGWGLRPALPPPRMPRGASPPAAGSPRPQSPHLTRSHSGSGQGHSVTQNAQWESQHGLGNNRVVSLKSQPPLSDAPQTGGALSEGDSEHVHSTWMGQPWVVVSRQPGGGGWVWQGCCSRHMSWVPPAGQWLEKPRCFVEPLTFLGFH